MNCSKHDCQMALTSLPPSLPPSIHPSVRPSVHSSVCLSVRPSIHLFNCPSFCSVRCFVLVFITYVGYSRSPILTVVHTRDYHIIPFFYLEQIEQLLYLLQDAKCVCWTHLEQTQNSTTSITRRRFLGAALFGEILIFTCLSL